MKIQSRKAFFEHITALAVAGGLSSYVSKAYSKASAGKRIGIIGLDTSHSIAFTKALNAADADPAYLGYRVAAAYPYGSQTIESSYKRIPGYTDQVKQLNVQVVDSIHDLLKKTDVILLETNDGRLHLEQALEVLRAGKRMFIDKPIAASLKEAVAIFAAAETYKTPVFSSSSLRFQKTLQEIDKSLVTGADMFSPATIEKSHPDLFWYGIHGVEALYTVMGTGCREVTRVYTPGADHITGIWEDGRLGAVRGLREGKLYSGGTVYTKEWNYAVGPFEGYEPLLREIIKYFDTGLPPVQPKETTEIIAFMEAAEESKRQGGKAVTLKSVLERARREN
ncbi:Gfo/Idh/MocA family oxidoreductase [Dyadobacter jiangsuensis]